MTIHRDLVIELRIAKDRIAELEAERDEWGQAAEEEAQLAHACEIEVARLREALERIASDPWLPSPLARIARGALAGGGQ